MKLVRQHVRTETGILLRSNQIFIYLGDGTTLADLFASDGTSVANPTTSTDAGVVQFYVSDVVAALTFRPEAGFYVATPRPLPVAVNDIAHTNFAQTLGGTAAVTCFTGQAVQSNVTGEFQPCLDPGSVIGIAMGSSTPGQFISVLTSGYLENSGYAFTATQPIYIGVGGFLTQNLSETAAIGFSQRVGVALTSTKILVNIEPPIDLA